MGEVAGLSRLASRNASIEADKLVRAAMAEIGDFTDAGLAARLRFDRPGYGAQRVARWRKGQARPNYAETIKLLEIAGWIDERRVAGALAKADEAARLAEEGERRARAVRGSRPQEEQETG